MSIEEDNDDMKYIKQKVGKVIAQGLAAVYLENPDYPIDFLAKWMLKYNNNQTLEKGLEETITKRTKLVQR